MKKKGFTLVELLAVIAILAIILLIAVPQILGVIDDAREDSFRNSVRNIFHAAQLKNARENISSGNIGDLDLSGETFLSGTWSIADGKVTLSNVCNKDYKIEGNLEDTNKGTTFAVVKSNGTCSSTPTETYLVDIVSVGDFVAYDAGTWTDAPNSQDRFGGYTVGQNKSTSVTCYNNNPNQYSGWRVLSKSGSGPTGTVTLVHAGTPECYLQLESAGGGVNLASLNNRANSQYVNPLYAKSARSISCTDLQGDNSQACLQEVYITNDMIKLGGWYWIGQETSDKRMWCVRGYDGLVGVSSNISLGLRPVVELHAGIIKTAGNGSNDHAYEIKVL